MKQTLSIKTGSGSSTGSLTFSASALTHVVTDYTLVTLPNTPGYVYKVFIDAYYIPTAKALTNNDHVKAYLSGYSGPLIEHSTNTIDNNNIHPAQLLGSNNIPANGSSAGNSQAAGLQHSMPSDGVEYSPGDAVVISIDCKSSSASTTSAGTYTFKYRYIGKAILTGTF